MPGTLFGSSSDKDYPYESLAEAFRSIGFDPNEKGNSFFVVTADVHYETKGTDGMIVTVNEINKMNPEWRDLSEDF